MRSRVEIFTAKILRIKIFLHLTTLLIALSFFEPSCNTSQNKPVLQNSKDSIIKKTLKVQEPEDSSDYSYIKGSFFRGKDGQLYEKKYYGVDPAEMIQYTFYDSRMPIDYKDSFITQPLSSIIDIETYQEIDSSLYSKDKKHVYYFNPTSDGGYRWIVAKANPQTFKSLDSTDYRWGFDKKHVFFKGECLNKLDPDKAKLLKYPGQFFADYISDGRYVYFESDYIENADANSFLFLNDMEGVDAKDKFRKYYLGRPLN